MAGDANYVTFVTQVSQQTGLDPRVIIAWVKAEGAYAPGGTGGFNYLNLRPASGDVYSSVSPGGFEQFSNVQQAVTATVRRLRMPFASGILATRGKSPGETINAIAASGWDAGHYGGPGGPKLVSDFTSLFSSAALGSSYQSPATARAVATEAGTSASDIGSADLGTVGSAASGAAGAVTGALTGWVGSLTKWIEGYAIRAAEVVGGFFLMLIGLYLLARQIGLASNPPGPVGAAVGAVS